MAVLMPVPDVDFDTGLIPGVLLRGFAAALRSREFLLQGYDGAGTMLRSLTGAATMGFGAMLAGGSAIDAGVTGTSTFALAPWVALTAMWAGAMATDRLVDQPRTSAQPA